jgi:hypothetical protein
MADYSHHLSFAILNEGVLRIHELVEKIRLRSRINIEIAFEDFAFPSEALSDQLVAFSPNRQFHSSGNHGAWRKLIAANAGIKEFRIQLNDKRRINRLGSLWRLVGDFVIRKRVALAVDRQAGHFALAIPEKSKGPAAQPFKKTGFRFRQ